MSEIFIFSTVFKKISSLSATLILVLLSAIFVVLFLYSKDAIKQYGLHFLVDPRWGVVIQNTKPDAVFETVNSLYNAICIHHS